MSENFKTIETQEELDKIIGERLSRQKTTLEKEYADYGQLKTRNEELETEIGTLKATIEETGKNTKASEQTVADLNAKIAGYETASLRTKIALQNGLPIDLADRLVGDDEASIKADAERLASLVGNQRPVPPMKDTEQPAGDGNGAYNNLLENLNLEGE